MATTDAAMEILGTTGAGTLYSALGTNVKDTIRQWTRKSQFLNRIQKVKGSGKACIFDAEFGVNAAINLAENADVNYGTDGYADQRVQAVLGWAQYANVIQITNRARATSSLNSNPSDLANLLGRNISNACASIGKTLDTDCFTGSGAANYIAGLYPSSAGAVGTTGTYAGLDRSTYTNFKAVNTQPSAGTALTTDYLDQVRTSVIVASGEEPDLLVCSPNMLRVLRSFWNQSGYRRWMPGQSNELVNELDPIFGMEVISDINISESDGYGKLYMLNSNHVRFEYLEPELDEGDQIIPLLESKGQGFEPVYLPLHVQKLSRQGAYSRWLMSINGQLVVDRPNSCAYIGNLSLTVS